MKKLILSAAVAAFGAVLAWGGSSPAVTQKEMVKYVAGATNEVTEATDAKVAAVADSVETLSNHVEAVREELQGETDTKVADAKRSVLGTVTSLSNYVNSVSAAGMSNYVHEAVAEMDRKTGETLTELTNGVAEVKTSANTVTNYYTTVKDELVSVSNFVNTVSPAGLSNYVAKVRQQILASVSGLLQEDDGMYADEGGIFTRVQAIRDGIVTNVTQYYDSEWDERIGTNQAMKVSGSTCDFVTNGTLLAVSNMKGYNDDIAILLLPTNMVLKFKEGYSNTVAELNARSYEIQRFIETYIPLEKHDRADSQGEAWTEYSCAEHTVNGADVYGRSGYLTFYAAQDNREGYSWTVMVALTYYDATRGETVTVSRGKFTLVPYAVYPETWYGVADYRDKPWQMPKNPNCEPFQPFFTNAGVRCEQTFTMTLTPRGKPLLKQASKRKGLPKLGDPAPKPTSTNIKVYSDAPHGCQQVDSWVYAGKDPEECGCDRATCYRQEDWVKRENWIVVPQDLTVYVYDEDDDAWYPKKRTCRTLDAVLAAAADYPDTQIPPPPWPAPNFFEWKDCDDNGHIWGKDCKCTICGGLRPHVWGDLGDGDCDKCVNHLTKPKMDSHSKSGQAPDGELAEQCLHKCDDPALSHHRGWHHTGAEGETEDLFCSCNCGYYSNTGVALAHELDKESGDTWTDYGDGTHHYKTCQCTRENCGHEFYTFQEHYINEYSQKDYSECDYIDQHTHRVKAKCAANGCTYYGSIDEGHHRDSDCWCDECQEYCHVYTSTHACGVYRNTRCQYCGKGEEGSLVEIQHDFTAPRFVSDTQHCCACGQEHHYHVFDSSTLKCYGGSTEKVNGASVSGDNGCHEKLTATGHKCMFKKKSGSHGGGASTDEDHGDHDDSRTSPSLDGGCPRCGGNVSNDDPTIQRGTDPTGQGRPMAWFVGTAVVGVKGSQHVLRSASTPVASIEIAMQNCVGFWSTFLDQIDEGSSFTATFKYNPQTVTVKDRSGEYEQTQWTGSQTYSGTAARDENDGHIYIKW